jgi:L-seryl-tRNA(Ser) seleniumtransferase
MIRSVYLQSRGIGRLMKVGKESIVGAMTALELWSVRDADAIRRRETDIVERWHQQLSQLGGVTVQTHADWTGNPITRLKLSLNGERAGLYAWELAQRLARRDPAVMVRDDLVEHGEVYLDPCNVDADEAQTAAQAIVDEVRLAVERNNGCALTWEDMKRERATAPLKWPG